MKIFPYHKAEIILNATPEQLIDCLDDWIEPWDPYARLRKHKLFWGSISTSGFDITRISESRGGIWNPTMYGTFISLGKQTKIVMESRPQAFAYPILILTPLFLFVLSLNSFWGNEYARSLLLVIPLGAAFILFIVVWAGFETGTDYMIRELIKITQKFSVTQ